MTNPDPFKLCAYSATRRPTREVTVRGVIIGGENPIRIQSMITCDTMDTEACVEETKGLAEAECEIVRITAPTVKDAANLEHIRAGLEKEGIDVPLVADIHFKPEAAMEAAKWVDKVRINPGNFADKKKFNVREYTNDEYQEELGRIEECFTPLVQYCQSNGVAMRIGTNHGSLSDRIMNYFGDTPLGMVESALEYARVARKSRYHEFVFSMKSSNPKVMINAYRLLAAKLEEQGPDWNYPLHLGVTEAGDGEDGRIKSAIGIGSLLLDGLGDTIRVSLTEDAIHEVPVCKALTEFIGSIPKESPNTTPPLSFDPFEYNRRAPGEITLNGTALGGEQTIRVAVTKEQHSALQPRLTALRDIQPELVYGEIEVVEIDPEDDGQIQKINGDSSPRLVTVKDGCRLNPVTAFRLLAARIGPHHPVLLKDTFSPEARPEGDLQRLIASSVFIGSLLCDGIGDAVLVRNEPDAERALMLAYNILQAAGSRTIKTEYVACPSCGRTLFNLQSTTAKIKAATGHLKGVKIAVMGCIVNGPGEMADADFGYVGGAPGKINLYVGKTPVKFNIPEDEAVERLKDLIREHGKWVDEPAESVA